ncbi:MAG: gliding motility-associated C-terminal domain-containing protein, partial [Bacteroidota bacterium]
MRTYFTFLLFCVIPASIWATHNRAGEITYEQIDAMMIRATITTYSQTSSVQADRDSLRICWGDGICEMLSRTNGDGDPQENDYKINTYVGTHAYAEMGTYSISMTDPNRNAAILNVNAPNSVQIQFHLQSSVTLMEMAADQPNRSPTLLVPPIDVGFVRQRFMHAPSAIDLDGDSIAYELVTPLMENDMPVPNYMQVDEIGAGDDNSYSFDEETGLFIWNSPQIVGQYNIAIKIKAFRNGELVDMLIRDMQILIQPEENIPPHIGILKTTAGPCSIRVKAGQSAEVLFSLIDEEDGQTADVPKLEVFSEIGEKSVLVESQVFSELSGTFAWTPTEADVRNRPYYVTIKATDSKGGATFEVVAIEVLPLSSAVSDNFKAAGYELFP